MIQTMDNMRSHDLTYLFSDLDPLPDRFFQGHAFVGRDYVFGQQGALDYEAHRGEPVPPREDGCYLTVVRRGYAHHIGVDFNGSKKVFYFRRGTTWCVSNSLPLIAEHLRGRSIPLTVNFSQLAALQASGTFASQQAATSSIFNEVKLLPTTWRIVVSGDGLHVHQGQAEVAASGSYETALSAYISTWVSRIRTLMHEGKTWLNVDLSGGVDSRTVFALISAARRAEGDRDAQQQVRLRSSTSPLQADDLRVATELAHRYGWEINLPPIGRPALAKLSSEERYTGWRDLSLGAYTSVYFPDRRVNPLVVSFHGAGGGHRPSYRHESLEQQVASIRATGPSYLMNAWRRDVMREEGLLTKSWPRTPPLMSHYHEYRNRFHSGLLPQYSVVFAPLGSRHVGAMASHPEKVQSGQILFDIMESAIPGLKDVPYITAGRAPSEENLSDMTVTDAAANAEPGRVFGSRDAHVRDAKRTPAGHLELMGEDLERSVNRQVEEFAGQNTVENARKVMTEAIGASRFATAADAKDVSRVLAIDFAFSATGISR